MPIDPDTTDRNTAVGVYRAGVAARDHQKTCPACPLTPPAMNLWRLLASHVDYDGACWPQMKTLCAELGGVNRSTVQRATAQLVAHKVIDVIVAHGRGHHNTYRLEMAPLKTPHQRGVSAERNAANAAPTRRFPPVDNLENAALVHQNAALVHTHIGEVRREVEERERVTIDNTGTLHPSEHPAGDDDWLNRWRDSMEPADVERCPNRPTSLPGWCGDDCPHCHGVGYVQRKQAS